MKRAAFDYTKVLVRAGENAVKHKICICEDFHGVKRVRMGKAQL